MRISVGFDVLDYVSSGFDALDRQLLDVLALALRRRSHSALRGSSLGVGGVALS